MKRNRRNRIIIRNCIIESLGLSKSTFYRIWKYYDFAAMDNSRPDYTGNS